MFFCRFNDIVERDMDFLFMQEFACSPDFLNLFLTSQWHGATIVSIEHSKMDADGETDITVIVEKDGSRYGLLIENKIDAVAQPQQAHRYFKRGNNGIKNGDYADFSVFIVAPQKYLDENSEAKLYPHSTSYESVLSLFANKTDSLSIFKRKQIEQAIHKQKVGWQAIADESVTSFWKQYTSFQKRCFPSLRMKGNPENKPANSSWICFETCIKVAQIIHKSEKGYIDLEFARLGEKWQHLHALCENALGGFYANELQVMKTGKSAVLRIQTKPIDFGQSFTPQQPLVEESLHAVVRLQKILDELPKDKLYTLYNN